MEDIGGVTERSYHKICTKCAVKDIIDETTDPGQKEVYQTDQGYENLYQTIKSERIKRSGKPRLQKARAFERAKAAQEAASQARVAAGGLAMGQREKNKNIRVHARAFLRGLHTAFSTAVNLRHFAEFVSQAHDAARTGEALESSLEDLDTILKDLHERNILLKKGHRRKRGRLEGADPKDQGRQRVLGGRSLGSNPFPPGECYRRWCALLRGGGSVRAGRRALGARHGGGGGADLAPGLSR